MANVFKKYQTRIAREGFIKALFCGLIVGCSVLLVSAAISWFFGFKAGLWLSLALFVVCTAVVTPIFYFKKFRPTTKAIAMRVDELGLEERLLTMTELENDDSYIAMRQREDALNALKSVDHLLIKIVVSAALIVTLAVVGVFGIGMLTVDALHYANVIPSGIALLTEPHVPMNFTLSYKVGDGEGKITYYTDDWRDEEVVWDSAWTVDEIEENDYENAHLQTVVEGKNGRAVVAEPSEGYVFLTWSDGVQDPYREDRSLTRSIRVTAIFAEIDPNADEEAAEQERKPGDDERDSDKKQKPDKDAPPPDESDKQQNQQDQEPSDPSDGDGRSDGGSKNENINDGQSYYGDSYGDSYGDAMESSKQEGGRSEGDQSDLGDYFGGLKKGKS